MAPGSFGANRIGDFTPGSDRLDLSGYALPQPLLVGFPVLRRYTPASASR